ncbi:MAG: PH domain-containing protein [Nanoarchaeota archaeon]|nr:PH domain-containing protein [Nanoarchaeota archaeon]
MELSRKQLHPGVKWSFRIGIYFFMFIFSFFIGWILGIFFVGIGMLIFGPDSIAGIALGIITFAVFYIIFSIIIAEIFARMSYNRWFYEFTEDNLKIERGIIWKRYSNIPYERIQNVDITRGIIARMLGFSTVNIQTAGFSYSPHAGSFSEGYIPAVDINEAEQIREFVMKKITKKSRKQGL